MGGGGAREGGRGGGTGTGSSGASAASAARSGPTAARGQEQQHDAVEQGAVSAGKRWSRRGRDVSAPQSGRIKIGAVKRANKDWSVSALVVSSYDIGFVTKWPYTRGSSVGVQKSKNLRDLTFRHEADVIRGRGDQERTRRDPEHHSISFQHSRATKEFRVMPFIL